MAGRVYMLGLSSVTITKCELNADVRGSRERAADTTIAEIDPCLWKKMGSKGGHNQTVTTLWEIVQVGGMTCSSEKQCIYLQQPHNNLWSLLQDIDWIEYSEISTNVNYLVKSCIP